MLQWREKSLTALEMSSERFLCMPLACMDREGSLDVFGCPSSALRSSLLILLVKSCSTGLPSARTFFRDFSSVSSNSEESGSLLLTVLGGLRGPDTDPGTALRLLAGEMYRIARGEVARDPSRGGTAPGTTRTGERRRIS